MSPARHAARDLRAAHRTRHMGAAHRSCDMRAATAHVSGFATAEMWHGAAASWARRQDAAPGQPISFRLHARPPHMPGPPPRQRPPWSEPDRVVRRGRTRETGEVSCGHSSEGRCRLVSSGTLPLQQCALGHVACAAADRQLGGALNIHRRERNHKLHCEQIFPLNEKRILAANVIAKRANHPIYYEGRRRAGHRSTASRYVCARRTSFSSLAYLGKLPIDVIKIDQSFVRAAEKDGYAVISAILSIAPALDLQVTAEGWKHRPRGTG